MTLARALLVTSLILAVLGCGTASPPTSSPTDDVRDLDAADAPANDVGPVDRPAAIDLGAPDVLPIDVPVVPDVAGCPPNQARCGNSCTDLTTPAHCGSCTTACTEPTPFCSMGMGGTYACSSGCSGMTPTRCDRMCVDTSSDPNHCGSCTNACPVMLSSTPTCTSGVCGLRCNTGFHPCGAGCDMNTDPRSCGALCAPCPAPTNATATCDGTSCGFTCAVGFHACGAACLSNADVTSCGTSCTPCSVARTHAHATCVAGSCGDVCDAGFHDCGGACVSNTDPANCGSACTACTSGAHANATCDGISCGSTCATGYHACSGTCVSSSAVASCGTACTACPTVTNASSTCNGTSCGFACATGFADCNGSAADGCETNTTNGVANCGACGHVCSSAHATPVCSASTCGLGACNVGFGNCDGMAANGCETATTTATSCGSCGNVCPAPVGPHTVATCLTSGGTNVCGAVCESGWTDCDSNIANGCEVTGACFLDRTLFYDGFETGFGSWTLGNGWYSNGYGSVGSHGLRMNPILSSVDPLITESAEMNFDVDASRAMTVQLTYQDYGINYTPSCMFLSVEASVDRGGTWTSIGVSTSLSWTTRNIDLPTGAGHSTLRIRFTYTANARCGGLGEWHQDEVRLHGLIRQY